MKNTVIIDQRMPEKCKSELVRLGFAAIEMPLFSKLSPPVSGHPDMLMFFGDKLYCHKKYYETAAKSLEKAALCSGLEISVSDEEHSEKYPNDILFNAAEVGSCLFCNKAYTSALLLEYAKKRGLTLVNVRQGYAKCSVCIVSSNAAITSDRSIAVAMEKQGVDVLFISPGGIRLDGMNYGFIGGASGADAENVFFCGAISSHPDGEKIDRFCREHQKTPISLSNEPLYDVGTIFFC